MYRGHRRLIGLRVNHPEGARLIAPIADQSAPAVSYHLQMGLFHLGITPLNMKEA
jgi:hypothetical protein